MLWSQLCLHAVLASPPSWHSLLLVAWECSRCASYQYIPRDGIMGSFISTCASLSYMLQMHGYGWPVGDVQGLTFQVTPNQPLYPNLQVLAPAHLCDGGDRGEGKRSALITNKRICKQASEHNALHTILSFHLGSLYGCSFTCIPVRAIYPFHASLKLGRPLHCLSACFLVVEKKKCNFWKHLGTGLQ